LTFRNRISLDGQWHFDPAEITNPEHASLITVPSPWQADERFRDHSGEAWYQRGFEVPAAWFSDDRVIILGFGAVDYFAEVWVNDTRVGEHEGGYLPFELDITSTARPGANTITVRVDDPLDIFPEIPHGKQSWYGLLSGIWQSVWIESRAAAHIRRVKIATLEEHVEVHVFTSVELHQAVEAEILNPSGEILSEALSSTTNLSLHIQDPLRWSPDEPNLYTLKVRLAAFRPVSPPREGDTSAMAKAEILDEVTETFGFRTIETRDGQILLNGRPFYLRGALDQDYYPDLIYTLPSLEYIENQFRMAKNMGLNCLRVHIKVADPRYYEAADKVGLLIWTELPNFTVLTDNAKRRARETLSGMLERDWNHPSIGIWTIINESWGIDLTDPAQRVWLSETYLWFKELDPTRLVVGNSACWSNFHVVTDIADFHNYYAMPDHLEKWCKWTEIYSHRPWWLFAHEYTEHDLWKDFLLDPWYGSPRPPAPDILQKGDEPLLVSEFGNWGLPDVQKLYEGNGGSAPWWFEAGLNWSDGVVYPHGIERRFKQFHLDLIFPTLKALIAASQRLQLDALKYQIENLRAHASIQGYVITELTDVHWESNGLLDMYRNPKVISTEMGRFNADDVLIPLWDRLVYSAGETCTTRIQLSHYSPRELRDVVLEWKVTGREYEFHGVQVTAGECKAFGITDLGEVCFTTSPVEHPQTVQIEFKLFQGEDLIASNRQQIYILPELPLSGGGVKVVAPDLRRPLEKLGYAVTEDLSQAQAVVVTVLDDTYRDFILHGGRILLLAEDEEALQVHVPGLKVLERQDTPWQGDWASSFGWHRFGEIPTGGVVNFAFADLTPEHILSDLSPRDFAFDVFAGLFVGWLHRPVPTIARRRMGQGEVLASTFRLSQNLDKNPLAMYLFAELMKLLLKP
jgi:hypothetical protein